MKLFSAFHNPSTKKYTIYYTVVLTVVTGTVLFTTMQLIHTTYIQNTMTFFEGFFSLFMLSRNSTVGNALLAHLSAVKGVIKPLLLFS
ncbi:MAG: hypothetical protein ABI340_10415 [Nitrososphaera sp.]